jgi:RNA polymerase sigma-70 factor, ECF subfamily
VAEAVHRLRCAAAERMMNSDDDRTFFGEQIERLADRLYGTALRLTRNRTSAEDLVSETVVKAWSHLGQLDDRSCFEKWILRILTNSFFSACRRTREASLESMGRHHPGDEDDEQEDFSLFDKLHQPFLLWWGTPEQELLNKLLREDLDAALDALPDCYRSVVILVELQGYSYVEAAETLAVPLGTIRSRLKRARSRLQRALWEQARAAGLATGFHPPERTHD